MFQTELKPVRVFRSTDTGAPQLTASAGSLKTILKACLKSGYGSTAPLDWDMPFEDTTAAVFKSKDPKSPNIGLHVSNTEPRRIMVKMAYNPKNLNTADDYRSYYNGAYPYLSTSKSTVDWTLVGHGRAFAFLVEGYGGNIVNRMLWFGDFPSLAPADTGNCFLWHCNDASSASISSINNSIPFWQGNNTGDAGIVGKSYDGLNNGAVFVTNSLCMATWGMQYPDVISSGLMASEIYLHEVISGVSGRPLRGIWPGFYCCQHNLSSIKNTAELSGFNGIDDKFIKINLNEYNQSNAFLINITAWPT